jgi:hypothetical protein
MHDTFGGARPSLKRRASDGDWGSRSVGGGAMSCYLRNLQSLFDTLELEYNKVNRVRVDVAIREVLRISGDAHCPEVWSAIKALSPEERDALIPEVGAVLDA